MSEYKPWVSEGITEVEYWKKRYIEARVESEAVRAEALEEAAVVCEDFAEGYKTKDVSAIVAQAVCHNAKHLAYRIRSLKGTATQSPWMPIETAPKDGTGFIGYERVHDGMYVISSCCFDTTIGEFVFVEFSSQSNCEARPTHWMPLPAPPTEEAG